MSEFCSIIASTVVGFIAGGVVVITVGLVVLSEFCSIVASTVVGFVAGGFVVITVGPDVVAT